MRKQYKRYLFLFATLTALLMGMSGTGASFAQAHARLASSQKAASQTCGGRSVVSSPNVGSMNNALMGVTAVSGDVWAVGYSTRSGNPALPQTLIEFYC